MKVGNLSSARVEFTQNAQKNIAGDRLSFFTFSFFLVSVLIQSMLILLVWSKLPPQLPIFFSRPWGENVLAPKLFLWSLPIITVLFFFVNYFASLTLARGNLFLFRIIVVFSFIVSLLTLYDTLKIVTLLT